MTGRSRPVSGSTIVARGSGWSVTGFHTSTSVWYWPASSFRTLTA
jgi:hypothetical protein